MYMRRNQFFLRLLLVSSYLQDRYRKQCKTFFKEFKLSQQRTWATLLLVPRRQEVGKGGFRDGLKPALYQELWMSHFSPYAIIAIYFHQTHRSWAWGTWFPYTADHTTGKLLGYTHCIPPPPSLKDEGRMTAINLRLRREKKEMVLNLCLRPILKVDV